MAGKVGPTFTTALACAGAASCSLFTDLGGLDEPPPATVIVVGDGGTSIDDAAADGGGGSAVDAAGDTTVPIVAHYARTLTLTADGAAAVAAGYTYCARLPPDVVGAAQSAGKMRADLADLRIYGASGEIAAVVDPLAVGRAEACFALERPIAAGAKDTYELHYGDANAIAPTPNRASFFAFYDDFAGASVDTSKWLGWGTPVIANGRLELRKGAEHGITTTASADGVPDVASLELVAEVPFPASEPLVRDSGTFWYWFGFQHTGDFDAYEPWQVFIARGKSIVNAEEMTDNGACVSNCAQSYNLQTTDKRFYRIDRLGSSVLFTYDDGTTYTAPQAAGDLSIMIRSFLAGSDVYVYWVRARAIASPEPTLEIGAEKTL